MKKTITVTVNSARIVACEGETLSEIVHGEKPCGGHGRCGKCKIIARGELSELHEAERRLLSEEEIARGVRLACLTRAWGDCAVETCSEEPREQIVTRGVGAVGGGTPSFSRYGVAIDVGTTTLAARLYGAGGTLLAETARINPQVTWGADVISRVEVALDGRSAMLAEAIRGALDGVCAALGAGARIDPKEIDGVVITGNTVMLSLLTETSVEPFAHAPFAVERLFGETLTAQALGLLSLTSDASVYLAPCISAFVGADTVCAILATELCGAETALLADVGTNGEMALWHEGALTVCSTAAGPAFEGVGISAGMRGATGAIDRVFLGGRSLRVHVIGETAPVGICGSGLVDAVACLRRLGVLDEIGRLEEDPFVLRAPISISGQDIRMLQLAKSAICAGMQTLLRERGVAVADVARVYLAGGFGNYLNLRHAEAIGLFPRGVSEKGTVVGNAALGGAAMLLLDAALRGEAERISRDARVLELSTSAVFADLYIGGMTL